MIARAVTLVRRIRRLRHATARLPPPVAPFTEVERAERIFYLEMLREEMTVFDAGANVDELTLLFSRSVSAAAGDRGCAGHDC